MAAAPDILCIGAAPRDIIGRGSAHKRKGSDVPGRITQISSGVALNVAMTLCRFGLEPPLLTAITRDPEGESSSPPTSA